MTNTNKLEDSNKYDFEYFSISSLKHRGWTDSKVKLWLKEPDKLVDNPHYKSAAKSKLYEAKRVKKFEKKKIFKEWFESSKIKREKLSLKQKETKIKQREKLINYINNLEIKIEKVDQVRLYKMAIQNYNFLWSFREKYEKCIYDDWENLDKSFLNRITINMLRHDSECYEEEIYNMFGKVGKDEAYDLLKEKVNQEIFNTYPFLFDK